MTEAQVIKLSGQAWAVNGRGERRLLQEGDRVQANEMIITDVGASIELDLGDAGIITMQGEHSSPLLEELLSTPEHQPLPSLSSTQAVQPAQAGSTGSGGAMQGEGGKFVQLVRIAEIIEADGFTPVVVRRIEELLKPLGMSYPDRSAAYEEEREYLQKPNHSTDGPDITASISINPITGDDIINAAEAAQDIKVTGTVGGNVKPGDPVTVTVNGKTYETTVNPDGKTWEVDIPGSELIQDSTVEASVTTKSGNKQASADTERPYELEPPAITPNDGNGSENPLTSIGHVTVFEKGLAGGSDPDNGNKSNGSVSITTLKGLESIEIGGTKITLDELNNLPGSPITIDTPSGVITITGFKPGIELNGKVVTGEIEFDYELMKPQDNSAPGDDKSVVENIVLKVTDSAGGTDTGKLVVNIIDDAPVAVDDTNVITEDQLAVTGNVIGGPSAAAGDEADTLGADGATVTEVSNAATGSNMTTLPNGDLVIEGQYGTLTIRPDGFYTYALNNEHPEVNALKGGQTLTEVFTYTLTDGDGDSDSADLTITINGRTDGAPSIVPEDVNGPDLPADITTQGHVTVHERGLTGADSTHINDGSVTITAPDGLQSITVGDVPVDLAQLAALDPNDPATHIEIDTPQGKLTLTGFDVTDSVGGVPTEGELQFTYELEEVQTTPADPADPDVGRNSTETIPLIVTDAGGGTGTGDLVINIIDDDPSIGTGSADPQLVVGESDLATDASTSFAGLFDLDFGADGQATTGHTVYELVVAAGGASGLVDSATGQDVLLTLSGNVVEGRNTDGDLVFTITLDPDTGNIALDQIRAVEHPTASDSNFAVDTVSLTNDALSLKVSITDRDGDTAEHSVAIGERFTFQDDGPSIGTGSADPQLVVGESDLATDASTSFAGLFDLDFGADGQATTGHTVYELVVAAGGASGLVDSATGQDVTLSLNGSVVEGRNDNGDVVFTITLDPASGEIKLDQARAVRHPDGTDVDFADDEVSLTNGALSLKVTITDRDGDTAEQSVAIGDRFTFQDDGPQITASPTGGTVDEAHLPLGSADVKEPGQITVSGSLNVDFGADGAGDVQFTEGANSTVSVLQGLNLASGSTALQYALSTDGHTLTAYRGAGRDDTDRIFSIEITDPTGTPGYSFTLHGALDHLDATNNGIDELLLDFQHIRVTDSDGDYVETGFDITVMDDAPDDQQIKSVTVDEDSTAVADGNTFNTNADATGSNTTIGDGSDGPQHGSATVNPDGTITYVPHGNYSGKDTFTYTTVTDNETKTFTVEVTVTPAADAPNLPHAESTDPNVSGITIDTPEDTAVELGLKTPVITDAVDDNGDSTAGDHPERLGAITLTVSPSGTPLATPGLVYTPDGAGTEQALMLNSSGGYTIVIVETSGSTVPDTGLHHSGSLPADNVNYLTRAEYESIQAMPAEDRHENFEVVVSVRSYEVDDTGVPLLDSEVVGSNGAEATQTITVDVLAVTDDVALEIHENPDQSGVVFDVSPDKKTADITLDEDTSFNLTDILNPDAFKDTDGSETRYLGFEGLPNGTIVTVNGTAYTIGSSGIPTQVVDGRTVPVIEMPGTQTDLPVVSIQPPLNFSGDLTGIKVILAAQDSDSDNPTHTPELKKDEITLNLYVKPVAGDINESSSHTIVEDNEVAFLSGIKVTDNSRDEETGGEVITQVNFTLPTDANGDWKLTAPLTQGGLEDHGWEVTNTGNTYTIEFNNDSTDGKKVLTQAEREDVLKDFKVTPPAHSSLDAKNWVISVTTVDSQKVNGSTVTSDPDTKDHKVTITVTPKGERTDSDTGGETGNDVTMTPGHLYTTHGKEDEWFTLGQEDDFNLKDGWSNEDGRGVENGGIAGSGSEETFALLTPWTTANDAQEDAATVGKLVGSTFSYFDGTDTHYLTFTGAPVAIPMEYLDTVEFKGPTDWFGVVKIEVNARTVDHDEDNDGKTDTQDSGKAWLTNLIIQPSADQVTLKVEANPSTNEDEPVLLDIRPSTSSKRTDVETTFDVTIEGIPEGAQIEYDGVTYTTDLATELHDPDNYAQEGIYKAADGSFVLVIRDFDDSKQPTLTPPKSSNVTINLSVTADSVDTLTYTDANGDGQTLVSRGSEATPALTHTLPIEVEVLGVPNTPNMTIEPGVYTEDGGDQSGGQLEVDLKDLITYLESGEPGVNGTGPDGSETVTLRISNLPEGFELIGAGSVISGTGDSRVWVVTKADLDNGNIKILVPQHWSGTLEFTAQPVVTENDNKAEKFFDERNVEFTVSPVAEATLSISSNLVEDTIGELQLAPVGADPDEYISTVRIAEDDLPAGVTLYADAAGTTPLVASGGYYTISNAGTNGAPSVYVKGPANFSGSITLDIGYQVTDPSTDGSLPADTSPGWQSVEHTLNFVPYTDQIDMELAGAAGDDVVTDTDGVITKTGSGTVDITLDISQLADSNAGNEADVDGSERLTHILISGLPGGVSVQGATQVGGGWLLPAGENWDGSAILEQVLTLVIGPYATDFESEITITAYSRDQGAVGQAPANNQELASITWTLRYEDGDGDDIDLPKVSLAPTEIEQSEDSAFTLGDVVAGTVAGGQNTGDPYELSVTVRTSPGDGVEIEGLTPTLVMENGEPVLLWTVTTTVSTGTDPNAALQVLLDSITVNAPEHANRNNLDGALVLDVTASVHTQGVSREERADIEVDIAPVTDALNIGVSSGSVAEGEDIPLDITLPSNTVDGELGGSGDDRWVIDNDLVYIHIADGDLAGQLTDADGTPLTPFTGTGPDGTPVGGTLYAVSPDKLAGLKFVPDADQPHQTGSLAVTVLVEHTENGGASNVSTGTGALVIHQSNSGYEAEITASGAEHSVSADPSKAIELQFANAGLLDPAETIDSAFISGLPDGFTVYYQNGSGDSVLANNAGDGTWVLPVSGGALPDGIAILPPKHWSGTLEDIKLTVRSGHAGLTPSPSEILFDLQVAPQADGLTLNPTLSFGVAGDRIALNLNVHMKDPRPAAGAGDDAHTERTTLELSGFPDAQKVLFYAGAVDLIEDGRATYESGTWTITGLTQQELDNLQFMHGSTTGNQQISIKAWTYEVDADGSQVGAPSDPVTGTMDINVDATLPTGGADHFLWEGSPIDGLGGKDTVQLRFGDNLGSGDFSQLSNIEVIDMSGVASGANTITALSVEDVFNMTDDGNLLKLLGDAEDSVTLGTGWGDGAINGDVTVYTATHGESVVKLEVQTTLIE